MGKVKASQGKEDYQERSTKERRRSSPYNQRCSTGERRDSYSGFNRNNAVIRELPGLNEDERRVLSKKVEAGVEQHLFFSDKKCRKIEEKIQKVVLTAQKGKYRRFTVDRSPLRVKYFFGEGYTYGSQLERKGPGQERLYPRGEVDEIPSWIFKLLVRPLEKAGILPKNWINSVAINDYLPGGCIVSHVDPPHIFDRPILTANFLSESALSFGCKFAFKPIRTSPPVYSATLKRGGVTLISGFAADDITHCVRPQDVVNRRAVIILRRVFPDAPRLNPSELPPLEPAPRFDRREDPRWLNSPVERKRERVSSIGDRIVEDTKRRRKEEPLTKSPVKKTSSNREAYPKRSSRKKSASLTRNSAAAVLGGAIPHCYADLDDEEVEVTLEDEVVTDTAVDNNGTQPADTNGDVPTNEPSVLFKKRTFKRHKS